MCEVRSPGQVEDTLSFCLYHTLLYHVLIGVACLLLRKRASLGTLKSGLAVRKQVAGPGMATESNMDTASVCEKNAVDFVFEAPRA